MLSIRPRPAVAALLTLALLTGCGPGGEETVMPEDSGPVEPAPPTPDPKAEVEAPLPPPPTGVVGPVTPGEWSSGALTIRGETANLRVVNENRRFVSLAMSLTFVNASPAPVSIILAEDGWPRAQLDNGTNMAPDRRDVAVLGRCSGSLIECRQGQRERFVEIEAGKTLSVTATFRGEFLEGGREDMQTVESGTVTMRVHVLEGDGLTRTLDVSLKDTPIRNRIN